MSNIYLLHNIGTIKNKNYNTIESILKTDKDDILTFDGVYQNVYNNREILKDRKVILFVVGSYIGLNNKWNTKMPLENFCTIDQILELQDLGMEIGWHTWGHRKLHKLSEKEIYEECIAPHFLKCKSISYPYGQFDERVIKIVKDLGYENGYSVNRGDNSQYQKLRKYLK